MRAPQAEGEAGTPGGRAPRVSVGSRLRSGPAIACAFLFNAIEGPQTIS